ncbi:MAG: sigma-70 family RNA polymerase sigma factor [Clostridia bacterium]|nr:sigma-70 family RNA polymerase sigma factor [Clostridia bacterium]
MADIEKLFREYYGFVYKFLLSRCGNADIAEELTQETFYRAFINAKQLKDDAKAVYWLCSIAKNLLYSHYKASSRYSDIEAAAELRSEQDVGQEVEDRIISERAMNIVKTLKEPYKEVFLLSVFASLPLKEISKAFGKSESWARVTLYRAKQRIVQELDL